MMIEFRSDHACIMHKYETDWMHARGQPASARAWPAASGQLAGFHFQPWGTHPKVNMDPIAAGGRAQQQTNFNFKAKDAPTPSICAKIPGWIVLSG